jgi:hypothetical protein
MIQRSMCKSFFHPKTKQLKYPKGERKTQNLNIYETMRPYYRVIKEASFKSFMEAMLRIDPKVRADTRDLLQHCFVMGSCEFDFSDFHFGSIV